MHKFLYIVVLLCIFTLLANDLFASSGENRTLDKICSSKECDPVSTLSTQITELENKEAFNHALKNDDLLYIFKNAEKLNTKKYTDEYNNGNYIISNYVYNFLSEKCNEKSCILKILDKDGFKIHESKKDLNILDYAGQYDEKIYAERYGKADEIYNNYPFYNVYMTYKVYIYLNKNRVNSVLAHSFLDGM